MLIQSEIKDGILNISLTGRLDTVTAIELRDYLSTQNYDEVAGVVFDLQKLEYVSSTGLRQFLTVRKRFKSNEDVRIINCSKLVMEIFHTTGFDSMMAVSSAKIDGGLEDVSFKELLHKQAVSYANDIFLHDEKDTYTWKELDQCSQILAADLYKAGVRKNTHVGICAENSVNWIIAFFAIQKLGGIAMLINFNLKYEEIRELTRIGDITHICFGNTPSLPPYEELIEKLTDDDRSYADTFFNIEKCIRFKYRLDEYESVDGRFERKVDSDDACVMIFSSGTTGKPKGVLLSAYNILNSASAMAKAIQLSEEDSGCLVLPLFHIFGLMVGFVANAIMNAEIYIPENLHTETIIKTIDENKCTLFHSVPTMMLAVARSRHFTSEKLASLRSTVLAGAAIAEAQLKNLIRLLPNEHFTISYGLSEMAPVSMTAYDESVERIATTVGKPTDDIEIRIFDIAKNEDCDPGDGKIGEILVRGYNMMACYYKRDVDDQSVDDEDWLHTGDLGFIDADGYLHISGRSKELIIRGGENIIPNEVASVIARHDNVSDVKVIGVPDDFYGEVVGCCMVLKDKEKWDEAEMKEMLEHSIAKYKIPAYYQILDEFPVLSNGKADMLKLKEDLIAYVREIKGESNGKN